MMRSWSVVVMLAWVAWLHQTFQSEGIDKWSAVAAAETMDQCNRTAVAAAAHSVRKFQAQNDSAIYKHAGTVIEITYPSGKTAALTFVCFPDTMDPRGAKGN
jgi:hypothetical protein